jgi:p-aminobenzoyl-glutamate transporter AbgT
MVHGGRTKGMLRTLLVSLVAVLAVPASAMAADGDVHKDRTTEIMLGIIFVLMIAMVLIGVLEGRGKH